MALRDRLLTRRVAEAMMSPSGIVLAGAGAAAGLVAGLPVLGAVGLGAAAWAARVAVAVPRPERVARIDPFTLTEPWRRFVQDALRAQARFAQTAAGLRPGPTRDRLLGIERRVAVGVAECWRVARRAQDIDAALVQLDAPGVAAELARLEAAGPAAGDRAGTIAALRAQLSSAERLARVSADARARLELLDARLDEAVARAIELSVGAGGLSELNVLVDDIEGVVGELEDLRQAIEETDRPGPAAGLPPA